MNPMAIAILKTGLTALAQDPQMIGRLLEKLGCMPNWELPTMGGPVSWDDVAEVGGWRVQKNKVFGNCRILDPNNVRRAWGGETAILQAFSRMMNQ
jgi:hypothetical protein